MCDLHVRQTSELRLPERRFESVSAPRTCMAVALIWKNWSMNHGSNLRGVEDLFRRRTSPDRTHDLQVTVFGGNAHLLEQLVHLALARLLAVPAEAHMAFVYGAHGLPKRLLEVPSQGHGLAHRLHRSGQRRIRRPGTSRKRTAAPW